MRKTNLLISVITLEIVVNSQIALYEQACVGEHLKVILS